MFNSNKKITFLFGWFFIAAFLFSSAGQVGAQITDTVRCDGFMTKQCNASCSQSKTVSEDNSYSYIQNAWMGPNANYDDQIGWAALFNGSVVGGGAYPANVNCGDVGAGSAFVPPITIFSGGSTDNDNFEVRIQALQKRTTEVNYFWGSIDFGYNLVTCAAGEIVRNNNCVKVSGTISASPLTCVAPCNITVTWNTTEPGLGTQVDKTTIGNTWQAGDSGSAVDSGLQPATYKYILNIKDGYGSNFEVDQVSVVVTPAAPPPPVCGNGPPPESGEECDDGNKISGDGCSSACKIEVPVPPAECSDNVDNDGNGFKDFDGGSWGINFTDPGCTDANDDSEFSAPVDVCPDNFCTGAENNSSCPQDCPPPVVIPPALIPAISPWNITSFSDFLRFLLNLFYILAAIAGIIAVAVILYAAILFMTSGEDQERRRKAAKWLKGGIIGIVVAIISTAIITIVARLLGV